MKRVKRPAVLCPRCEGDLVEADGAPCKRCAGVGEISAEAYDALCAQESAASAAQSPQTAGAADASLVLDERGVSLYRADWRALAAVAREAGGVDALIVDAPYSERTHAGHDDGVAESRLAGEETRMRVDRRNGAVYSVGVSRRRTIDYAAWTDEDVRAFVGTWTSLVRGWIVSITDHALAPSWERWLKCERYVFAPLPLYSPGSRVRLSGDGPSAWTCWIVVARPTTRKFLRWGTLPGGYQCAPEPMPLVGGKPLAAMRALVRDYTRPGDLVCDPCAGAGTLGVACVAEGRRALLGDRDEAHVAIAAERLRALPAQDKRGTLPLPWEAA